MYLQHRLPTQMPTLWLLSLAVCHVATTQCAVPTPCGDAFVLCPPTPTTQSALSLTLTNDGTVRVPSISDSLASTNTHKQEPIKPNLKPAPTLTEQTLRLGEHGCRPRLPFQAKAGQASSMTSYHKP